MAYYSRRTPKSTTSSTSYTVKLTGLSDDITQQRMEKFLRLQRNIPSFVSVRVLEGYALINYSSKESSERACSRLDGKQFDRCTIRAKIKGAPSNGPTYFTVKINHLSSRVGEEELESICSKFGHLESIKVNKGFAYVNFSSPASAENAIEYLNKVQLGGQTVSAIMHNKEERLSLQSSTRVNYPKPQPKYYFQPNHQPQSAIVPLHTAATLPSQFASATIKVELNDNHGLNGKDLYDYFNGKFGNVEGTPIIHDGSPDYAYVNFADSDDAARACKQRVVKLKGVKLTIKLTRKEKKSIPKEDTQLFVTDDCVVNQLLAKQCFTETEKKLRSFDVTIRPAANYCGLQVTGSEADVAKANILLNSEASILKTKLMTKSESFHCNVIPCFSEPELFQTLQQTYSTEFCVIRTDGVEEKTVSFCAAVTKHSKQPSPMKVTLFDDYFVGKDILVPCWYFQDDNGKDAEMSTVDSQAIEHLYQRFKRQGGLSYSKHFCHAIGRFSYEYDFSQMKQENTTTQKKRTIKRFMKSEGELLSKEITIQCRGLAESVTMSLKKLKQAIAKSASTIHGKVEEKFADDILERASEYCVKAEKLPGMLSLEGNKQYIIKVSTELKQAIVEAQSCSTRILAESQGPNWEPQTDSTELKDVSIYSEEGQRIQTEFHETLSQSKIVSIQRIQNKMLWEKYSFCKGRMTRKNGASEINEKRLFHGPSQTSPEEIYLSDHGFDFRFSRSGNWGRGVYFATTSKYSNNYAYTSRSHQQMFLAFVLTGDSIALPGNSSLDKPPLKPSSLERYDSVNGQQGTTRIYIIYDHEKSYPAYLITYT